LLFHGITFVFSQQQLSRLYRVADFLLFFCNKSGGTKNDFSPMIAAGTVIGGEMSASTRLLVGSYRKDCRRSVEPWVEETTGNEK